MNAATSQQYRGRLGLARLEECTRHMGDPREGAARQHQRRRVHRRDVRGRHRRSCGARQYEEVCPGRSGVQRAAKQRGGHRDEGHRGQRQRL
jgi:hypothetical protein